MNTGRRPAAWVTLLALVATLALLPAAPAQAFPIGGCKEAPVASVPSASGPAWFGAHASQEPTGQDPFVDGSTTSIYREYGWPTSWWPTYDLGCGPDIARNPGAVVGSFTADGLSLATLFYATTFDALVHAVLDWQGLEAVDNALGGLIDDLRQDLWLPLITIVLLLTAAWFIIKVMRGEAGQAMKAAVFTLAGSLLLVVVLNYPEKSAQLFDGTVRGAVAISYSGTIPEADSSAEIADGIVSRVFEATMYDRWCEGMVGGDADAAAKWCPELWRSLYVSRAEHATVKDRADLIEDKADAFEEIAEEMEEENPAAYAVLTGRDYQTRLFSAGAAHGVWPLVSVFPLFSLFLLLVSLMLMRVAVMLAPVLGPILIHPAARRTARSGLHVLGAALINAVLFGVASALFLRIEVAVMSALDMPIAVRLVVLGVLMVAFFIVTRPFRRLRNLRPRGGDKKDRKQDSKTTRLVTAVTTAVNREQGTTTTTVTATAPPPTAEAGNR